MNSDFSIVTGDVLNGRETNLKQKTCSAYLWKIEPNYMQMGGNLDFIQGKEPTEVNPPSYKDLLFLIIQNKYQEVIAELKYERDQLGKTEEARRSSSHKKPSLNSERNKMRQRYFETINEEVFMGCSIEKFIYDRQKE
mmetsp:Transcript_30244/g.46248  ORF Transcript_30244/g.46248 Transcript_30244/m.46248 type:complete len:138 (-) Transcript_30244:2186-2599(-)